MVSDYLTISHTETLLSIMCRTALKDQYNDYYLNRLNINDRLNDLKHAAFSLVNTLKMLICMQYRNLH